MLAQSDAAELAVTSDQSCAIMLALFLLCAVAVLFAYSGHSHPRLTAFLCSVVFVFSMTGFSVSADRQTRAVLVDTGNGMCLFVSKNRENLLIGAGGSGFSGGVALSLILSEMKGGMKAVFVPDAETEHSGFLIDVLQSVRPEKIYYDTLPDGGELLLANTEKHSFEQTYASHNFTVRTYKTKSGSAAYIKTEDVTLLVCFDPSADIDSLPEEARRASVLVTRSDYPENISRYGFEYVVVNAGNARGVAISNELKALGIKSAATAKCGSIQIRSRKGYTVLERR